MSHNDDFDQYLNLLDYNPNSKKDLTLRDEDFKKTKNAHMKDKIKIKKQLECEEAFITKVLESNPVIQENLEINSKTLLYLLNNIRDEYDSDLNQKGKEKLKRVCTLQNQETPKAKFKLCSHWRDCLCDSIKAENTISCVQVNNIKNKAYLDKKILIKLFFKDDAQIIQKLDNFDILREGIPPKNKPIKYIKIKNGEPKLVNGLFLNKTPQNKYRLCSGFNIFWTILPSSVIFYKK